MPALQSIQRRRGTVICLVALLLVHLSFGLTPPRVSAEECNDFLRVCVPIPPAPGGGGGGGGSGSGESERPPGGPTGGSGNQPTGDGAPQPGTGPAEGACAAAQAMGLPCEEPATPQPPPLIPVDVDREAYELCNELPLPRIGLQASPATGMIQIPTTFFISGYRGEMLTITRSWEPPYEPTTIDIRAIVTTYTWNFGDGGAITTAKAPLLPGSDEVRNTYRWSSTTEPGGSFHTSVRVVWDAQYRVNGGAWQQLTTLSQQYEAFLPVRQSQPIVTNP